MPEDIEALRKQTLRRLHGDGYEEQLEELKRQSEVKEMQCLAPYATPSGATLGRSKDEGENLDNRTAFTRDRDRILHSEAFFRLGGKTQVFISPSDPHISTRLTHTIHVAQIARSLARALGLNEDLVEAIALGHDLGHGPFGHTGEEILDKKCQEIGLPKFKHNVHSLRVIDVIEKGGAGLNLSWEVRDGILRHDGEAESQSMTPTPPPEMTEMKDWPQEVLSCMPSSPEACLVRVCDRIAYAGKDIEDGIKAGLFRREEIPREYTEVLGDTNNTIIDTVINDVILNFNRFRDEFKRANGREPGREEVRILISPEVETAINGLIRDFNYPRIYFSDENRKYIRQTKAIVEGLFDAFLAEVRGFKAQLDSMRLDDFADIAGEYDFDENVVRSYKEAILRLSLGDVEALSSRMENQFSRDGALDVLGDSARPTAAGALDSRSPEEFAGMVRGVCDAVKLRILMDSLRIKGGDIDSIAMFLFRMNDNYFAQTSTGEMVRDAIASLTDRRAISIFEMLNIPQSIV